MDAGNGRFEQIMADSDEELKKKARELEGLFPNHGGWFSVGEVIEIRGSRFRVKAVKSDELRLKLLPRIGKDG
jgi:uncharacterized Zn finger protein